MHELPLPAAFDQPRIRQGFQMVGNRRGGNSLQGNNVAAGHVAARCNRFINPQARLIGQGFRYLFNLKSIHKRIFSLEDNPLLIPQVRSKLSQDSRKILQPTI